jgi:D-alanine transaminase
MEISYINGKFLPKEEISISPDDRGFLFAEGVYEVSKWYSGFFFDMESHVTRLKRSLRELKIGWTDPDRFPSIATELIRLNDLQTSYALVYLQVTRGAARRTHNFPSPEVTPTVYAFAWGFTPELMPLEKGVAVMLKEDIRWSRCDIKSVALLANTLSFNEAYEKGMKECIFVRNGYITEGSHSNIFFVIDGTLFTHPESNHILSGVTRRNIIRIAKVAGLRIKEEAVLEDNLKLCQEAFITNTSAEITPVIEVGGIKIGDGNPGPVTRLIRKKFDEGIMAIKG